MTWVLRHPQKSQGPDRHWGHDISNFGAHYGELTEIIICECLYCDNIVLCPEGGFFLHLLHLFSDSLSLALLSEKRSFWHLEAASVLTISDIYTYLLWTCFEERKKFPEFFLLQLPTRILGTFLPLLYNLGGQEVRDSPTSLSHRSIFSKYWHCNALFKLSTFASIFKFLRTSQSLMSAIFKLWLGIQAMQIHWVDWSIQHIVLSYLINIGFPENFRHFPLNGYYYLGLLWQ